LLNIKLLSYWSSNLVELSNKHNLVNNFVLELYFGLIKSDLTFNLKKPFKNSFGSFNYIIPNFSHLNMSDIIK